MKKFLPILFLLILAAVAALLFYSQTQKPPITSFEECVAAGNPVMESYPAQCRAGDQTFTQDIGNEIEKMNIIRIESPRPNQTVSSPMLIKGQARGNWFFEGSFPVYLYDTNGNELAVHYAQTQGEWMTEEFVNYESELVFETPETKTGILLLKKQNASGLPEHDDELRVPVIFE